MDFFCFLFRPIHSFFYNGHVPLSLIEDIGQKDIKASFVERKAIARLQSRTPTNVFIPVMQLIMVSTTQLRSSPRPPRPLALPSS